MQTLRKIGIFLSVLILLSPTFIKLEHHHEYSGYVSVSGERHQTVQGICHICNFEFSFFLTSIPQYHTECENIKDSYQDLYLPVYILHPSGFSFLLRAPPAFTN